MSHELTCGSRQTGIFSGPSCFSIVASVSAMLILTMHGFHAYASTIAIALLSVPGYSCTQDNGTSTASCAGSYNPSTNNGDIFEFVDGSSSAIATYGVLGATANMAASAFDSLGDISTAPSTAISSALFDDTAKLYGPRGTIGTLLFTYLLYGSAVTVIDQSNPANPQTEGSASARVDFLGTAETTGNVIEPVRGTFELPFDIETYDPVLEEWYASTPFGVQLSATASCSAEGEVSDFTRFGTCDSSALFGDTFELTGIIPVDASGNPLTDVNLSTASGTDYNALQTEATPEAPTAVLTGIALILLGGIRAYKAQAIANHAASKPTIH
jgi:hypothetical protein